MDWPMTTVGLAAAFCLIGVIHATAQGQKPKMTTAIFVPSDKATFKEVVPGALRIVSRQVRSRPHETDEAGYNASRGLPRLVCSEWF
jgi:hypothetical protein